jgi:hypothetical protein
MNQSGASTSLNRTAQFISKILLTGALILLAYLFVVYLVYAFNLISFPFDYDQGEGFELYDVVMFGQFQWPYADIETYPFYGSIYPPLYHVLLVPFYWIFGAEYWYGRLFSFLTTLITAYLIGYTVQRETFRNNPTAHKILTLTVALLSGLAFLSSNIVYHIGPLFRQHISMFMFETIAIVLLAHANEITDDKRRRNILLLGFMALICAGYTKQLAAFTAISALLFLLIRNPRRAIIWGMGFGIVTLLIFAFLTIATNGHWWTQSITANVKDFSLQQATGLFMTFFRTHFWLIVPSLLWIVYEVYFDHISIYSIWFVVTLGLNAFSAGTWGAGDSYYATPIAAMCVISGLFASRTLTQRWTFRDNYLSRFIIQPAKRLTVILNPAFLIIIPLFYLGYGQGVFHMPTHGAVFSDIAKTFDIHDNTGFQFYDPDGYITLAYAQIGHLLKEQDRLNGETIVERINAIPDDVLVLSEEAGFSFATNREIITNPVVLKILDDVGVYDSSELVQMLEEQQFGLIVLRAQFFPVAVNIAITTYYEEAEQIVMNGFGYKILYPRDVPLSPTEQG